MDKRTRLGAVRCIIFQQVSYRPLPEPCGQAASSGAASISISLAFGLPSCPGLCQGSCYGSKWSAASASAVLEPPFLGTPASSIFVLVGL